MAITKFQIQAQKAMAEAFERYDTENGSDFISYDAAVTTEMLPIDLVIDSQKLITDAGYKQSFDRFADTIIAKFKEKGWYEGFKSPQKLADTDMKNLVEILDNYNDDNAQEGHFSISIPLTQGGIDSFNNTENYPNSNLFFGSSNKKVSDGKEKLILCEFNFDLNKFYTDAEYNAHTKEFLTAVQTRFNDKFGKKDDGSTLTTQQTEAAIIKTMGHDIATLYSFANAMIDENYNVPQKEKVTDAPTDQSGEVAEAKPAAPAPRVIKAKELAPGVNEYGVFTDDGIQTLPREWFDQHLTAQTRQLIVDRNDTWTESDQYAYSSMANDGVSLSELQKLIYFRPGMYGQNALANPINESWNSYWYSEGDETIKGVISNFQATTRIFTVNFKMTDESERTVSIFVDTAKDWVGTDIQGQTETDNVDGILKYAFKQLYQAIPSAEDPANDPYDSFSDVFEAYGQKMNYLNL